MEFALWNGKKISASHIAENYKTEKCIRIASSNGELKCPDPACQHPILKYCHGDIKDAYFAHRNNENCDYALFDASNTDIIRNVRKTLYQHFRMIGYNVQLEEKVLPHHYTHLLIQTDDGQKVAIEIGHQNLTATYVDRLDSEYQKANIPVIWIVIGETGKEIVENQIGFIKRYQLNESQSGSLLVINEQCSEITQYKIDPNSYIYRGQNMKSKNYPEIYQKSASVQHLIMHGTEPALCGFDAEYSIWLKHKQKAFQKLVSTKENTERLNTELKKQLALDRKKLVPYLYADKKREPSKRLKSYDECKAEIMPKMNQYEEQVRDSNGGRWIRCRLFGKIDLEHNFSNYGGAHQATIGICRDCAMKQH